MVRIKSAEGNYSAAVSIIEPLYDKFSEDQWDIYKLEIAVLFAVVLYKNNEKEKAFRLMEEILSITESENIIRLFIDEGKPMFDLLTEIFKKGIKSEYISSLLNIFKDEKSGKKHVHHLPA